MAVRSVLELSRWDNSTETSLLRECGKRERPVFWSGVLGFLAPGWPIGGMFYFLSRGNFFVGRLRDWNRVWLLAVRSVLELPRWDNSTEKSLLRECGRRESPVFWSGVFWCLAPGWPIGGTFYFLFWGGFFLGWLGDRNRG